MNLDYFTLEQLRQNHPAWRLLRSDHAPVIASFLQRTFIAPNVRVMPQAELAEALEDELFGLREQLGTAAFPKTAQGYLDDWAANDKGWLRKFYPQGSDEPHFDLTPATEKAIAWQATKDTADASSPVVWKGLLFFTTDNGFAQCYVYGIGLRQQYQDTAAAPSKGPGR